MDSFFLLAVYENPIVVFKEIFNYHHCFIHFAASVPQVTRVTQHPLPVVMNVDLSVLRTTSTIQQCRFLIVGLCRNDVDKAMAKLKDLYQDQCCTQTLKKEDLAGFTQDNINSLKQLMEILGLYVEEDLSNQGRWTVRGLKDGVNQMMQSIHTSVP